MVYIMRIIFRKVNHQQQLSSDEYCRLMKYAEHLRSISAESYELFYERYALLLYQEYSTYLPRFAGEIDDLINFLISEPEILSLLAKGPAPLELFPDTLHDYLQHTLKSKLNYNSLVNLLTRLKDAENTILQLPQPRKTKPVLKYEDSNPYKEIGLKTHFDRLSKYSFITRLQSYRYLTRNKASYDKIEFLAPDRLGGIFTNKEKSIYYYIFLSEADPIKTRNACQVLNLAFYNRNEELT